MTPEQQERERQLMRDRVSGIKHFEPFEGEIKEIDLNAPWYCPFCISPEFKQLELNADGLGLHCTEHYMVCDYEHENAEGRAKSKVSWSKRHRYPLSLKELIQARIELKKESIKKHHRSIEQSKACIDELKEELAQLERGEIA